MCPALHQPVRNVLILPQVGRTVTRICNSRVVIPDITAVLVVRVWSRVKLTPVDILRQPVSITVVTVARLIQVAPPIQAIIIGQIIATRNGVG